MHSFFGGGRIATENEEFAPHAITIRLAIFGTIVQRNNSTLPYV